MTEEIVNTKPLFNEEKLSIIKNMTKALPGIIYWKDREGRYLFCNDAASQLTGLTSIEGKTDYDLPWANIASQLQEDDKRVMELNTSLEFEERLRTFNGEERIIMTRKTPLLDEAGNIVGIMGTSLDITKRRAMEELQKAKDLADSELKAMKLAHLEEKKYREEIERMKMENTKHKAKLEAQLQFTKMAQQVVHDIRSPLASILMIVKACEAIPERERIALRAASTRMSDIANNLLLQYKLEQLEMCGDKKSILLSATLLQLLTEKKFQYQDCSIEFQCQIEHDAHFAFILVEPTAFNRMISNLINNAVDACHNKIGKITVKINATHELVKIVIMDNGKGMSKALSEKIINNMKVTEGKVDGNGIGLTQVRETLSRNEGILLINSQLGEGTEILLKFQRIKAPLWIAEEITISHKDIIVILDDDHSIHAAWDSRFEGILTDAPDIIITHFEFAKDALSFINNLTHDEKNRTLLLTDYELLHQEMTGLDVIEQAKLSRTMLVTSYYEKLEIQEQAYYLNAKILPKQLASEIPINITKQEENSDAIHAILVDDDLMYIENALNFFFVESDRILHFTDPEQLKENLFKYPNIVKTKTKICLDNNYQSSNIKGVELAKDLHALGYTQLYLISGDVFLSGELPEYLNVVAKEEIGKIKDW